MSNAIHVAALCLIPALAFAAPSEPSPERAAALRHLLVQDCGSCHGLTLKGGLGPALLPTNLAGKPAAFLTATILDGRNGTAMPPWRSFLTDGEAAWLAETLLRGMTP